MKKHLEPLLHSRKLLCPNEIPNGKFPSVITPHVEFLLELGSFNCCVELLRRIGVNEDHKLVLIYRNYGDFLATTNILQSMKVFHDKDCPMPKTCYGNDNKIQLRYLNA